jgi:type II secretory pathway pseudopilin PulG
MNNQTYQIVKLKRYGLLLSLLGLVFFALLPAWNRHRTEAKLINAQRQAEVLAYQAFEIYRSSAKDPTRGPASASQGGGSLGTDPWGQPYRYKILNAGKDQLKVQIWSAGPNRNFETTDLDGIAAESYGGDDVGIVLSMTHRSSDE